MIEIRIDKLLRSKRRTIGLEITQDAKLVVRAPFHVSQKDIESILFKKRKWILEKQKFSQEHKPEYTVKAFINGESFYFLGKPYRLKLVDDDEIKLTDNLEFPRSFASNAKENLVHWYKTRAYEKIKERTDWYAKIMGLEYASIKISNAYKRLGSCNLRRGLNFSWRLIMAHLSVIDYVVVHELIHLEERNHSTSFWSKVKIVLPNYDKCTNWLKNNEYSLHI